MPLEDDFQAAQARVKQLPQTPAPNELLDLYALFKQATAGDVSGSRPGMLDFKGRAKYDAWATRKGTSKNDSMQAYVALVQQLVSKYGG
jgi:diazepam-binding inhibitor (GABA receptor modulator, acyl-CoA-binding protein)